MRIDHVQLAMPEGQEDTARVFWIGAVGMEEMEKPEPLRARGGVWFRSGEAQLHLGVEDPFLPARKAHPCFAVDALDELADRLLAAEVEPQWDESLPHVRRFFVADPFGNRVEFLQR
ncbi:VOC family protein [Pelagovum pacificum]|uniref:Glyoxalase n=1 Tax=Pelagovum pacificum TaxID=2588711 RepID=A0A5C5GIE3_9RHOB|nr:VOC family protein [Pelagovum pacificum]QQA42950.1 glyoxalase [Pelagovum pacificum]TNY33907.1 glyoxalase [Pelagovum pacificum]